MEREREMKMLGLGWICLIVLVFTFFIGFDASEGVPSLCVYIIFKKKYKIQYYQKKYKIQQ